MFYRRKTVLTLGVLVVCSSEYERVNDFVVAQLAVVRLIVLIV